MRRITVDLPDWATGKLVILADGELAAKLEPGSDKWQVKDVRCIQCGSCCHDMIERNSPFGVDDEGRCKMVKLEHDRIFTCQVRKWFARCADDPLRENVPDCSITYTEQDV